MSLGSVVASLSLATAVWILGLASSAYAQPRDAEAIDVYAGYGLSAPYDDSDTGGRGLFATAEYAGLTSPWAGFRPYATWIQIWADRNDEACERVASDCEVTAAALMLGGKGRLAIPIPYVAPFIELGLGASLGSFRTRTEYRRKALDGVALHLPVSLGLAVGPNHDVDLAMVFYFHPAPKQDVGGYAIGLSIPLE